jgi:hypothetical protein
MTRGINAGIETGERNKERLGIGRRTTEEYSTYEKVYSGSRSKFGTFWYLGFSLITVEF